MKKVGDKYSDARRRYEGEFAEIVEAAGARAFARGRHAIYTALRAIGVGPGDLVGVCAYTCLSVVEAVIATGARCVFLDVDHWMNIDSSLKNLDRAIDVKVIILQYTFGVPSGLDATISWATLRGIPIIEDCSHALGSRWKNRPVGSFGMFAVYSSQWGKSYSTGQGGMLTASNQTMLTHVDDVLQEEAVLMRVSEDVSLAIQRQIFPLVTNPRIYRVARVAASSLNRIGVLSGSFEGMLVSRIGLEYPEVAAPLLALSGLQALHYWPKNMAMRRKNYELIRSGFENAGLNLLTVPENADPVFLRVAISVPGRKNEILEIARKKGLDIAGWYNSPVHPLQNEQLVAVGYNRDCPVAELQIASIVHLPTKFGISQKSIQRSISAIVG